MKFHDPKWANNSLKGLRSLNSLKVQGFWRLEYGVGVAMDPTRPGTRHVDSTLGPGMGPQILDLNAIQVQVQPDLTRSRPIPVVIGYMMAITWTFGTH
ncbi:hypothetical protein AMTRI_Chr13g123660 [Amborella trichopoda]